MRHRRQRIGMLTVEYRARLVENASIALATFETLRLHPRAQCPEAQGPLRTLKPIELVLTSRSLAIESGECLCDAVPLLLQLLELRGSKRASRGWRGCRGNRIVIRCIIRRSVICTCLRGLNFGRIGTQELGEQCLERRGLCLEQRCMNALFCRGRRLRFRLAPQYVDREDGIRGAGGSQRCPNFRRGAARKFTRGSALHCARERRSTAGVSLRSRTPVVVRRIRNNLGFGRVTPCA